jgi:hypothetical protein
LPGGCRGQVVGGGIKAEGGINDCTEWLGLESVQYPIPSKTRALSVEHLKFKVATTINIMHVSCLAHPTNPLPIHVHSPSSQQTQNPVLPLSLGNVTLILRSRVPLISCECPHTPHWLAVSRPIADRMKLAISPTIAWIKKCKLDWTNKYRNEQLSGRSSPDLPPPGGSVTYVDTFNKLHLSFIEIPERCI